MLTIRVEFYCFGGAILGEEEKKKYAPPPPLPPSLYLDIFLSACFKMCWSGQLSFVVSLSYYCVTR